MVTLLIKIYQSTVEFMGRMLLFSRNMPDGFMRTNNIRYSKYCKLDIFSPSLKKELMPVVIYIHGGGWTTGSKRSSARQCAVFAKEGYVVLNINYRLGPRYKHPAQIEDISNVMSWLNANAEDMNCDIGRIFFAGSSAGAHLSCLAACIATKPELREKIGIDLHISGEQIAGIILLYGGFNMESIIHTGFFLIKTMVKSYVGTTHPEESKIKDQISPVQHITCSFPPVFITAGERDPLYSQSIELISELEDNEIAHTKLLFSRSVKNAGHAFINYYYRDCSKAAYKGMIAFINEYSAKGRLEKTHN